MATTLGGTKKVKSPIFILGTGRSGTTILGKLLSMHKSIGYLNEPKALWNFVYPYEDLIGSYSNEQASYYLSEEHVSESVATRANRIYSYYLTTTCSSRVCDKYPELIFRIPFIKQIFPDAKFIFLTRNGIDTIHSVKNWSSRLGVILNDEIHDWWGVSDRKWNLITDQVVPKTPILSNHNKIIKKFVSHEDRAAVEWICTMQEGLKYVNKADTNIIRIRYEELVGMKNQILPRLIEFLELPNDPALTAYAEQVLTEPLGSNTSVELNPNIINAFNQTMTNLGYS
jgi:hypothetical protein